MSQQRQLREYDLARLMLKDRQQLHAEFLRVAGQHGSKELQAITDRDKIIAILRIEYPAGGEPGPNH